MKQAFLFALMVSLSFSIYAQECECPSQAPEGGEVMKTFSFGEGKGLGICGYSTVEAEIHLYKVCVVPLRGGCDH